MNSSKLEWQQTKSIGLLVFAQVFLLIQRQRTEFNASNYFSNIITWGVCVGWGGGTKAVFKQSVLFCKGVGEGYINKSGDRMPALKQLACALRHSY